jgi:3-isopropylmalate dehydrogenase
MVEKNIAVLAGDGIGPEIMAEAVKVLKAVGDKYSHTFNLEYAPFGGEGYDKEGNPFPERTKEACDSADAILKGPIGGPKYDKIQPPELRPERGGLLPLRRRYDTFANLRIARLPPELASFSPLRPEVIKNGIDILFVRELVGGIYFGRKEEGKDESGTERAIDVMEYTRPQVERIARVAFAEARKRKAKLHNLHKSNVLQCSIFWNRIVDEINRKEYPDVAVEHMLIDNAAYTMEIKPSSFSVVLAENMMGDIITDQAAGAIGSLGLMPSACMGPEKAYFEPAHGSAPALAGTNTANPYAMIASAAMMLDKAFGLKAESEEVFNSLFRVFGTGHITAELTAEGRASGIQLSTSAFGDMVASGIEGVK